MFCRRVRSTPIVEPVVAAFVHQLSPSEAQAHPTFDIIHDGAVFDIKLAKKEDTLMVEKLKAYRAELEAKKEALLAEDVSAEIETKVAEYKAVLEADAAANKEKAIAKVDSDIDCLDKIIAAEIEKETVAVVVDPVEPTVNG